MPISKNDLKKISALKKKPYRKEVGCFVVEGLKNCTELIKSDINVIAIYVSESNLLEVFPNSTLISQKEILRMTHLKSPSSILAVAEIPKPSLINKKSTTVLYLDNIKDPGNMGTIIRTLDWFGHSQLFCSTDSVDNYNSKVIMASMGSSFRVSVHYLNFDSLITAFPNHNTFGTFIEGENLYEKNMNSNSIIVMGNESNGISHNVNKKIKNKISIPSVGQVESLNLSTATAIVLSEIYRCC
jgi:TrmH family RNA methyltransferase